MRVAWICVLALGCTFAEERGRRPVELGERSSTDSDPEPSLLPRRAARADDPPPPTSGGTLEVAGDRLVVADPFRDTLWILGNPRSYALEARVDLGRDAEPGRILVDSEDSVLVVLRGAGAVARVDLDTGAEVARAAVCEAPRGIAERDSGYVVACVGGSLVFLDDALVTTETREVVPDLRDVVVQRDTEGAEVLWVSTFRRGTVYELRGSERITHELPAYRGHVPRVAWRMRADQSGDGVRVLHEQMSEADFTGVPLAYYGSDFTAPGSRIVQSGVALLKSDGTAELSVVDGVPFAVDFTTRRDQLFLAAAFVRSRETDPVPGVFVAPATALARDPEGRVGAEDSPMQSVAIDAMGQVIGFSPRTGRVFVGPGEVLDVTDPLGVEQIELADPIIDSGHDLFHATTPAQVTCASCHPGGRDDAYVWTFSGSQRRTQSLTGGILSTAPYHWTGDHADLAEILFRTFDVRMNGPDITYDQVDALGTWLDALPALRVPPRDMAAVARGEALYAENGCAGCHDAGVDPATTLARGFQAPSLVGVGVRGPFFHDGCARDLDEALDADGACPAGHPGLPDEVRADVVAYLEQL